MIAIQLLTIGLAGMSQASGADLSRDYDQVRGRFCEVTFGTPNSRIRVRQRAFQVETEGGAESRSSVRLCGGRVAAELSFDLDMKLYRISLQSPSQCLAGICVGQTYAALSRPRSSLSLFIAPEEGGVFSLRSRGGKVHYNFNTDGVPIRCFRAVRACRNVWNRVRVSEIAIMR